MIKEGGRIPYLASGTDQESDHTCNYLEIHDAGKFTYTYKDRSENGINLYL